MALIARYPMNWNANNVVTTWLDYTISDLWTDSAVWLRSHAWWTDDRMAQSINITWSNILKSIRVRIAKWWSPTGTISCKVYTWQDTWYVWTATNTISESSLTASYADYTFNFDNLSFTWGNIYFVFETTRTYDGSNYLYFQRRSTDWYAGWTCFNINSSNVWNWLPWDLNFIVTLWQVQTLNWTANNVSWVDGKEWQAASFSWVSTSNITILSWFYDLIKARNDYWFDFWVYSWTTVNQIAFSYSAAVDFYFYVSSAWKIMLRRWTNYTSESWTSFEFNKWQKFTIQYTSETNANIYKNWNFIQSFTVSATPNITSNFYIWRYFDTTFPFTWKIDRFQVWTWNLSVAEIKNDYLLTSGYYG